VAAAEDGDAVRLFLELTEAPEAGRARRLALVREDDPSLARRVERLLLADAEEGPLERIQPEVARAAEQCLLGETMPTPPEHLGSWRLLERLGVGGMGEVWLAERTEGGFAQQAAVKLVRTGMSGPALVSRFLVERQVLARLDHAAIAKVLDGGVAPDGRPWFAMERVDGVPIMAYARERALPLAGRLRLLAAVCDAVDYAHRNLVVHRDLKPSNILITPAGEPKLLDFGLAKLLDQADDPSVTHTDMLVLTPAYAAPEQVLGGAVTTATDVYALGALLCELLTGRLPHRRAARTAAALADEVRSETVTRPSVLVRGGALEGADEPAASARELAGELDLIVLKALHQEPERRYAGAAALADDLRAFLDGRPIAARPDTVAYRGVKFVGRHRAGVAAALLVALSLAGGTVAALVQAQRARAEARRAERIKDFAVGLFTEANVVRNPQGRSLAASDLLQRAAERIEQGLRDELPARAEMRAAVAEALLELDGPSAALPLLERSIAEQRSPGGADPWQLARTLRAAGKAYTRRGDLDRAEAAARESLALLDRSTHEGVAEARLQTRTTLVILAGDRGRHAEAAEMGRRNLEERRALFGADAPALTADWNNLAAIYVRIHRYAEAEQAYREAERVLLRDPDAPQARLVWIKWGLSRALWGQGRFEEARGVLEEARAVAARTLGPEHQMFGDVLMEQGIAALREGRPRDALELLDGALRILAGSEESDRADAGLGAAQARLALGRDREAAALLEPLARWLETRTDLAWRRSLVEAELGRTRARLGRVEEGERQARVAVAALQADPNDGDAFAQAATCLAEILERRGTHQEARRWRARAVETWRAIYGPEHAVTRKAEQDLAAVSPS
jgi:eukaryotic-like serine/threonine-protein kinase